MEKKQIVVAGGGTAGWIAAAALAQQLGVVLDVVLVESEEIGTVGVGESSIPPMRVFHRLLNIDEQQFMRETGASFKLGIVFDHWSKPGDRYVHSFGRLGQSAWLCEFHHFWLQGLQAGILSDLDEYCLEALAAKSGRFATSSKSEINYAYHLDAMVYAKFLRKFAEGFGVRRIEGKIQEVRQNAGTGFIEALILDGGRAVAGDFFIDCTGFRGLLIEQALHSGYEDWSHWLPCDSALPVQTEAVGPPVPYTRAIAHEAGWRWQIPLQHRVGNGIVYCSRYLSDDDARNMLYGAVEGKRLVEPKVIRFRTGRRRKAWNKNVVALGLASGFVEPLESTSIHLIMTGITRLMQLFPFDGVSEAAVERFNEETRLEAEKIRDFIVLHYHATQREDTPFWRYCRNMEIPETLAHRIRLFRENGHAWQDAGELFRVDSWVQVLLGQGIVPKSHHPLPRTMAEADLKKFLHSLRASIAKASSQLPTHQEFIDRYCKA
jgi:tryptophan halogenase